ncbi:MAG: alpha/beta hydrolase [Oscillospiraceae bacterium]|jgi:pimeloyl-ACP methyl ester carboxylesterase|nr:alpha/beta hydrolase [Oscillospiraceae bacterium]
MAKILLLHGWLESAKSMRPIANLLSEKHEVTALNLPKISESLTRQAEWLFDYLAAVPEPFDVIAAHSMGCALLLRALTRMDASPAKRILLCCPAYGRITHLQFLAARRKFCERVIRRLFPNADAATAANQAYELTRNDWRVTGLPNCSITVIAAQRDFLIRRKNIDALCSDLRIEPVIIPNVGHNWLYNSPERLVSFILSGIED